MVKKGGATLPTGRSVVEPDDELVAVGTSTLLSHRTAEEIAADPDSRQQEQTS